MALLEAMVAGTAIVASATGVYRAIVDGCEGILSRLETWTLWLALFAL